MKRLLASILAPAALVLLALPASAAPPWLGATLQDKRVVRVTQPSPAAWAGVEPGDTIIAIDGVDTPDGHAIKRQVMAHQAGEYIIVRIARGERRMSLAVRSAVRPAHLAPAPERTRAPVPEIPEDPWDGGEEAPGDAYDPYDIYPPEASAPAPVAADDEVADFDPAAYRGRVLVVSYMATWCGACRSTFDTLNAWVGRHERDGLAVVTVSSEDRAKLSRFRDSAGLRPAMAFDEESRFARAQNVEALPTFFVFDRGGALIGKVRGADPRRVEALFTPLLRGGERPDDPTF